MENTLIINSDLRTVVIPDSIKNLGVEHDDDVLQLHFSMPKMYGAIDLSAFNIRINYLNANNEGDVYPVVDNHADGDNIAFSWLVSRNVTAYKGNVRFIVCLRELDEAGDVSREFNTTPASLPVLEGLETTSMVVQQNPDILEHILLRLDALEQNGTGGPAEGAVLYTEQTLTPEQQAQARANIGAADDTIFESFEVGGSNNILPPDYESGHYSATNGQPTGHSSHIRTPSPITIAPNRPIFVTTNGFNDNTNIIVLVLYYDENDNFISTSTFRHTSFNASGYRTPANAVKMNVSFNNAVPAGGTMADVCISYTQLAAFEPYSVAHTQKVVKEEALPENVTASAKAWANANLYVYFDGTNCYVKSKYSKTEDLVVRIAKGGGNNLPDIRQVYTVANLGQLNGDLSVGRNFYSTQSDHIGPQKVAAVNNVDGDAPDIMYFTGGSHQTNNQTSGGATTARNDGFVVLADNVQLANYSGVFCEKVRLHWTNYIQGYNTSKADGTGREILKEDVSMEFSSDGITVDVCHKALEDVMRHLWYGLQGVIGIFEKIRFIGGSNRMDNDVSVESNSGDNKCRTIAMHNSLGDYAEIGIYDIDIGDFSLNTDNHSAHTPASKCYFNIIRGNGVEQKTNETTFLRGYYRFKKTL